MLVKVQCDQCEKKFYKLEYDIKRTKNNFCSKRCCGDYNNKKVEVTCVNCKKVFSKRLNQIEKTGNNFCSKSCAATYNNKVFPKRKKEMKNNCIICNEVVYGYRKKYCDKCLKLKPIKKYFKNELSKQNICLNCGNTTSNKIFCSQKCRKEYTAKKKVKNCLSCGKKIYNVNHKDKKFCDMHCFNDYRYKRYIVLWMDGKKSGLVGGYMTSKYIRRYLREIRDNVCEECGWSKPNAITGIVPLDVHHIDGDYKNMKLENLKLLCKNCHSITSFYGSLNKGRGRPYRQNWSKK